MAAALVDGGAGAIPISVVTPTTLEPWLAGRSEVERAWLRVTGFSAKPDETALVPGTDGRLALVVQGVDAAAPPWALASLPFRLPEGVYTMAPVPDEHRGIGGAAHAALGWALGAYQFARYRRPPREPAQLIWPDGVDRAEVTAIAEATAIARDLINTSAEQLGPAELADAAREIGGHGGARVEVIAGDDLLRRNYPAIHAVGRSASRAPCLIDLAWGDEGAPRVTLVGKGVCFDSGGLDLKSAAPMKLMKSDMGGAATMLGLAYAIMATGLALRLRVLIPAVENLVSATALRPSDVIATRKGLMVEVANTDAEGRLILGDALAEASRERPALLVDIATLTQAARIALGPDLQALFANDEAVADAFLAAGIAEGDHFWRLPLWPPYRKLLDSRIADLTNLPESNLGGSITAALYLQEFVEPGVPWIHIDTDAWNAKSRPGRPEGGETFGLRAIYRALADRFGRRRGERPEPARSSAAYNPNQFVRG